METTSINTWNQEIKQLHQDGYCRIPNVLPNDLLVRLQELFSHLIADERYPHKATTTVHGTAYTTNLDKLMDKGNLSCLELLGLPLLWELAERVCGPDFFMIQEFGVIKMLGDTTPVLWHQDMLNQRTGTCITIGIYLDEAEAKDGALQVVPKSHLSNETICALMQQPFVEIPMKAGDILIHDMMLAHASQPLQKNKLRRVLYFEFLSATQALTEAIYSREVIENRWQLLQLARVHYQQLHPSEVVYPWQNPLATQSVTSVASLLEQVQAFPITPKASAYCLPTP